MPRIRLAEQEEYEFRCIVTVQPRDINYGGHLSNDALVSLLATARVRMFGTLGSTELDLGDRLTGIIMSDLVVNFKAEAFMLDELAIETHIGEFTRVGFRLFHRITKGTSLVALAETGMVALDYKLRKTASVPEVFLDAVRGIKNRAESPCT